MTKLDALVEKNPVPGIRIVAWCSAFLITVFILWSTQAKVDEVTMVPGMIAPESQVKVIQHLEGGIISELLVKQGDTVEPGDPLLRLDLGVGQMNPMEIEIQLDGMVLTQTRLEAEAQGIELVFPEEQAGRLPAVASAERRTYSERKREAQSSLDALSERVHQREQEVIGFQGRRREVGRNSSLARQQLAISNDLMANGLASKVDNLGARRDVQNLAAELRTLDSSIQTSSAGLEESRRRFEEEETAFKRQSLEELSGVEVSIARLREQLREASGQRTRTEVRSPIYGVVKDMRYNTIGGVVRAGDPIMEIVPIKDSLVVEGRLALADRGYVRAGMPATVKVTAFDFIRYGSVTGTVLKVGADSREDQDGSSYFPITVETDSTFIGGDEDLILKAGMEAMVDVHTGERTVLSYLVSPVLRLKSEAFRER